MYKTLEGVNACCFEAWLGGLRLINLRVEDVKPCAKDTHKGNICQIAIYVCFLSKLMADGARSDIMTVGTA